MNSASVEITALAALPARAADAHKGDFGRVLVVAGSTGLAGAGALTALAALRAGTGLVTLLVPARTYEISAGLSPCVMTHPSDRCPDHFTPDGLDEFTQLLAGVDVVALGPGLGRHIETGQFVLEAIKAAAQTPLVLDADGLYAVRGHLEAMTQRLAPTILTPHPGEGATLMDAEVVEIQADRTAAAEKLAKGASGVAVLKGHRTVVTDGERHYVNPTGNAGMATAGSGDVLTGVIAALVAQGLGAFQAACLGTCLHGLAGDLAAEEVGQPSLIATDIIDHLSGAFTLRAGRQGI